MIRMDMFYVLLYVIPYLRIISVELIIYILENDLGKGE